MVDRLFPALALLFLAFCHATGFAGPWPQHAPFPEPGEPSSRPPVYSTLTDDPLSGGGGGGGGGSTWALMGDTGLNVHSKLLWRQLSQMGVDGVIHAGDMAYEVGRSRIFVQTLDRIFGSQIPYLATIGDHDVFEHGIYAQEFNTRNRHIHGLSCKGRWGYMQVCQYQNVVTFGLGIGFVEDRFEEWLVENLERYAHHPWKICFWHRVGDELNPGHKNDGFDEEVYEICRRYGAIVLTGHEHMYGRSVTVSSSLRTAHKNPWSSEVDDDETFLQSSVPESIPHNPNIVDVSPGKTVLIVSGLSGAMPRTWNPTRIQSPLWASVVARQNMATFGALVCRFPENPPYEAFCVYKDIEGFVWDRFVIRSSPPPANQPSMYIPRPGALSANDGKRYPVSKAQHGIKWNTISHIGNIVHRKLLSHHARSVYAVPGIEGAYMPEEQKSNAKPARNRFWSFFKKPSSSAASERSSKLSSASSASLIAASEFDAYVHDVYATTSFPLTARRIPGESKFLIKFTPTMDMYLAIRVRLHLTGNRLHHSAIETGESGEDQQQSRKHGLKKLGKLNHSFRRSYRRLQSFLDYEAEELNDATHKILIEPIYKKGNFYERSPFEMETEYSDTQVIWPVSRQKVNEAGKKARWKSPSFHSVTQSCEEGQECSFLLHSLGDDEPESIVADWMNDFLEPGLTVTEREEKEEMGRLRARIVVEYRRPQIDV